MTAPLTRDVERFFLRATPEYGKLDRMGSPPHGFEYSSSGERVEVRHHGRAVTTLRGAAAAKFLADVERGDPQHVMARVTGNYKRGNER